MKIGYAISTLDNINCLYVTTVSNVVNFKTMKIIKVLKCPECGYSDDGVDYFKE